MARPSDIATINHGRIDQARSGMRLSMGHNRCQNTAQIIPWTPFQLQKYDREIGKKKESEMT